MPPIPDPNAVPPVLLDPVSNELNGAHAASPSKLYVVDRERRIACRSGPGPASPGNKPAGFRNMLDRLAGSTEGTTS